MAVLGNRATGLLDMAIEAFKNQGQELQTPPMASPAPMGSTPLQRAMGRQEVAVSMPEGRVMSSTTPEGQMYLASTTPQVQQALRGTQPVQERTATMNIPQVATVQTNPSLNQEPSMQLGEGVYRPGADVSGMEKLAEDASKVVTAIQKNPELEKDPTFMDQVKGYFGNRENMVKLALAFNTMRLTPDTGLASALSAELKDLRAQSKNNATISKLALSGNPTYMRIAELMKKGMTFKQAYDAVKDLAEDAKVDVKGESDLRKELEGLPATKNIAEVSIAFERIKQVAKDPSPAGDLALIFNFMKMLDPASVVRESEFRSAEQARGWLAEAQDSGYQIPAVVQQAIQKLQGEGGLLPEQRADFLNQAGNLYQGAYNQYAPIAKRYGSLAEQYGFPAERVVRQYTPYDQNMFEGFTSGAVK